MKTMLRTNLESRDGKVFSKVNQIHLGRMPAEWAETVANDFPAGFCISGSGEDRPI
jgi:hypothetical protein